MLVNITIKQLREIRGLSQEYMAMQLKISQPAYCKIEKGYSRTSDANYLLIAHILQVNADYIRTNKIPSFFYVDDEDILDKSKNKLKSEYVKLVLNNIVAQREFLIRLLSNDE